MKKFLSLSLTVIVFVFHGAAQAGDALSLSLGPALPVGAYASKNGLAPSSGLANIGGLADVSYQQPFGHSRFGWMASIRGRFNGVDKKATIAPFAAQYPSYQWSMNWSHWSAASALIGGYYKIPLTTKLDLVANIEVGLGEAWTPKQNITGYHDSVGFGVRDAIYANLHSASAIVFTGLAGLGIRYKWRSRWALSARLDYDYLKPTFNITASLTTAQNFVIPGQTQLSDANEITYYTTTRKYTQPMPCIEVMIGIIRDL